jgi:AraC-like DNA-binding protein
MPRFRRRVLHETGALALARVECDGADAPRPADEGAEVAHAVVPLSGRFVWRGRAGRRVVDPTGALLIGPGDAYAISHPSGEGDVCLSVRGAVPAALFADGRRHLALDVPAQLALLALASAPAGDPLAVEEGVASALAPPAARPEPPARAAAVADAIAFTLAGRFDEPLGLGELAAGAGVSVFQACRLFRHARGTTIHGHRLELRLRHALGLLLDTRAGLADVAARAGFANQGHLGNRFRARFGVTPGQARARGRVERA